MTAIYCLVLILKHYLITYCLRCDFKLLNCFRIPAYSVICYNILLYVISNPKLFLHTALMCYDLLQAV